MLDCSYSFVSPRDIDNPPAYEDEHVLAEPEGYWQAWRHTTKLACMDRHDRNINMVFLDWSVRRVGPKELWTLRWHRGYKTLNPWTKAGGVRPEDWPEWMRKFKDY
jgi:prepilin-type processing-associated H-X9-DG protein